MTDEQIIKEATEAVEKGLDAGYAVSQLLDIINRQKAETKCEDCAGCSQWKCDCANERIEAVKEFAERVKKEINFPLAVWRVFDNILAEMTDPTITKVEHNSLCETETYRKGES